MKLFVILQGIPGIGKSTFIQKFFTNAVVICPDAIRIEMSRWATYNPMVKIICDLKLVHKNLEENGWSYLIDTAGGIIKKGNKGEDMKMRLTRTEDEGDIVLWESPAGDVGIDQSFGYTIFNYIVPKRINDAVNSGAEVIVYDATNTKADRFEVANYLMQNGYDCVCVHFPEDGDRAKRQNKMRPAYKYVPDFIIDNMLASLKDFDRKRVSSKIKFVEADDWNA